MCVNLYYIKILSILLKFKCFWFNEEKIYWGIYVFIICGYLLVLYCIFLFFEIILILLK